MLSLNKKIKKSNKRAALEMSVGTIVTIVLLMSMLVLGIVLIQKIFSASTSAVGQIDDKIKSQINTLFDKDDTRKISLYPNDAKISIKQGTQNEGFFFALRNLNREPTDFTYTIEVDPEHDIRKKCSSTLSARDVNDWIINPAGSISLGPNQRQENPELILFDIPDSAPGCTIPFKITVKTKGAGNYDSAKMFVTVVGK